MALKRISFLVLFGALFSILVLIQNQGNQEIVLKEASTAKSKMACVPCGVQR